ncbi:hypothetical protein M5K25_004697 [Dendrobium thyrsiflorum]|uniref:CCHC-type domain-containing protein n=1 Tax=Dendrobium thyrsiflorum TaxID=117978 RepID=A0ABD0VFT6_DENTH
MDAAYLRRLVVMSTAVDLIRPPSALHDMFCPLLRQRLEMVRLQVYLMVREGGLLKQKTLVEIVGKGKNVVLDNGIALHKNCAPSMSFSSFRHLDNGVSSSDFKADSMNLLLDMNDYGEGVKSPHRLNPTFPDNLVIAMNSTLEKDFCPKEMEKDIEQSANLSKSLPTEDGKVGIAKIVKPYSKALQNGWSKKSNINVTNLDFGKNFTGEGSVVKIHSSKELKNTTKLRNSLVIKVFGENISFEVIVTCGDNGPNSVNFISPCLDWDGSSVLLRKQKLWKRSFPMVLGLDRWSPSFSPLSLKGIFAPIWIRMPNLPLHCWDEINVCRIASMVGKPYLIDGNMFQWSRMEFSRICVRLDLDSKLPMGVWVEGSAGRFYQTIEYEKIPNFCFSCGKIGHLKSQCPSLAGQSESLGKVTTSVLDERLVKETESEVGEYGPWIHVNFRRNKFKNQGCRFVWIRNSNTEKKDLAVPPGDANLASDVAVSSMDKEAISQVNLDIVSDVHPVQRTGGSVQDQGRIFVLGMDPKSSGISISDNKFSLLNVEIEEGEVLPDQPVSPKESNVICMKKDGWVELDGFGIVEELGRGRLSLYIKEFMKDNGVFFLGLMETKTFMVDKKEVDRLIGTVGLSGSILVLWRNDIAIFNVLEASQQVIIGDLNVLNKGTWRIATIYGSKDVYRRRNLWEKLEFFSLKDVPMVIGGHFNYLLDKDDKRGGKKFMFSLGPKEMKSFLSINDFHEVGSVGPRFT